MNSGVGFGNFLRQERQLYISFFQDRLFLLTSAIYEVDKNDIRLFVRSAAEPWIGSH
jgi:hypothetical protein